MLVPIDVNELRSYSLKADAGEPKSVFRLGFFDEPTRNYIFNLMRLDAKDPKNLSEIVRFGLRGWENFGGEMVLEQMVESRIDGKKRSVVSPASMAKLYPTWIAELANEIFSQNFLTGDEEKN